uniref:FAD_binding_6 domain-containing protein n=1 Tax=Glossina brevipalpis TaxID=37001 RepID=A0A1A9WVF2_9MUSC
MEYNENDCCGNGCANCILNMKSKTVIKYNNNNGKINVLNKYNYYVLLSKTRHISDINDILELHFKSKENGGDYILTLIPGGHVMMRITKQQANESTEHNKYHLRPYSPYWWNNLTMEFKILVNLKPQGYMSQYIERLQEENEVEFRGLPDIYEHNIDSDGKTYQMIITQGIAIASTLAIIEEILNNEEDMTRIVHVACFPHIKYVYFRNKFKDFNQYWNYKSFIYLSQQLCESKECQKMGHCLEDCLNFHKQLTYKETIYPYRLTTECLRHIKSKTMDKQDYNKIAIIAGGSEFQKFYKKILTSEDLDFVENNIYLL